MNQPAAPAQLQRAVGLPGATLLGLGSILGTGVFVSIGLSATLAGPWLLLAVAVAALVATANGLSSAQLAAAHPVSGGTYAYGRKYLNPLAGYSAGWLFLCAKSASASTACLGFASYLLDLSGVQPTRLELVVTALATLLVITAVVLAGLRRSSQLNLVLVVLTLVGLGTFVVYALSSGSIAPEPAKALADPGALSVLEACALMFVAYTGYGRVATMGEEITEPARNIPRAIISTLIVSALVYAAVAWGIQHVDGARQLAGASLDERAAPLLFLSRESSAVGLVVSIAAMLAMLGVLLNLLLGLSRVWFAMGRDSELPAALGKVRGASSNPVAAVVVTALVIALLVLAGDVKLTWSFSAFTVLLYYAFTNLCALRLPREDRRLPRAVAVFGLVACLGLAWFVEWRVWLAGLAVLLAGLLVRTLVRRRSA